MVACSDPTGLGTEGPLLWTARLNGVPWTVGNGSVTAHVTSSGYLLVAAFRRDSLGNSLDLMGVKLVDYVGPGRYQLTPDASRNFGGYAPAVVGPTWISTSSPPGEIWITEVDTAAHRIAGLFDFRAQAEGGSAYVSITDGRFRAAYDTVSP